MNGDGLPPPRSVRATWVALWGTTLATYVLQMSTTAAVKTAGRDAGFTGGARPDLRQFMDLVLGALGALDWIGIALLTASLGALLVLELRGRRVSRVLGSCLSKDGRAAPLLLLITAWAVRGYVDPGMPHGFDAKQHMSKAFAVTDVLAAGEWPTWSWRWYGGFPLLRFYGPLSYWLAGGLGLLTGAVAGVKLTLLASHALSGWAIHGLARRWSGSRQVATLATIVYLLAYQRIHTVLLLGRLPEAVLWALFPLLLLCVERFLEERSWRPGIAAGVTLGALVLTHPVMGALGGLFAALYCLARLALETTRLERPLHTLGFGAVTGGLAFLLSAFWLIPALDERPLVLVDLLYGAGTPGLFPTSFDAGDLPNLLRYGPPGRGASPLAYAGYTVLLLAAVGAGRALRRRWMAVVPPLLLVLVAVIYGGGGYFLARAGAYITPFLALLAGAAIFPEPAASGKTRGAAGLALCCALIVVIDLLPLTVTSRFRPDLEPVRQDIARLTEQAGAARVVIASRRADRVDISQWTGWDGGGAAVLGGPFREGATDLFPWCMAVLGQLEGEFLESDALAPNTVRALRLLGVKYVAVEDGSGLVHPGLPEGDGYSVQLDPPAIVIDGSAPLLTAGSAFPVSSQVAEDLDRLPRGTDIPRGHAALAADSALSALVASFGDGEVWPAHLPLPAGGRPIEARTDGQVAELEVRTVRHTDREIELEYALNLPQPALLPFATYPGVRIDVDGDPLPMQPSAFGPPVVELPSGLHRLTLRGPDGPRRTEGRWLSLFGLLLVAVGWLWTRRPDSGEEGSSTRPPV